MAAMSILTVKFIAIGLTKELAGNYNSAYGYLQLFGILADFGLYAVAVREVSRASDRPRVLGALMVLRLCTLLVSLGTAILFVWILPQWRGTPFPMSVLIASLVPFFTLLAGMIRTIFQVGYRMHFVFIAEVTQRIITTGLIATVIILGIRGSTDTRVLYLMLATGGVGAVVLFLLSIAYGSRLMAMRLCFDRALMKSLLLRAAPFGLAYLCIAFSRQFDLTMIALLRSDFQIQNAYYGFVVRMSDMGFVLPTYLLNSMLPTLSDRDREGGDTAALLGRTFLAVMLIGVTAFLFSFLWSRPVTGLLTTPAYLSTPTQPGSDTALELLSIPLLMNGIILYSFYVLLHQHAWKALTVTLFFGALLSLGSNALLIPRYGFVGAAWTSVGIHLLLAALLLPQAIRAMHVRLSLSQAWKWVAYAAGLGLGLGILKPFVVDEISTVIGLGMVTLLMFGLGWVLRLQRELL